MPKSTACLNRCCSFPRAILNSMVITNSSSSITSFSESTPSPHALPPCRPSPHVPQPLRYWHSRPPVRRALNSVQEAVPLDRQVEIRLRLPPLPDGLTQAVVHL